MGKANHERKGTPGELRRGLMLYGSTAALAAALMLAEGGLGPALAQDIGPRISPTEAAQGSFVVPGPSPTPYFEYRSAELDIVRINRDSAILNWTTYDTDAPGGAQGNSYVNFLPEGAELRFTGGGESYTVINRVFTQPDNGGNYRGIAFQGEVSSYLFSDGPSSVGPVGGNIWFYSPGGILATGTSSFNVGSLVLSASDIANFNDVGTARFADLTGVANPFASVILQQGAQVTLTQPNSSFAIVAPTIIQGGDVMVDGSVLYMSAETGFLYFYNNGQVSGSIYQEAQAGNEIRHLGTTTGPASLTTDDFSIYDPHTIEFRTGADVGVLLSGTVGYAAATDAALGANGAIVLYAGAVSSADLTLSSNTSIEAPRVDLTVGAGESLTMGGDVNGNYALSILATSGRINADAGGVIDIAGDVSLRSPYQTASYTVSAAAGQGARPGGQIDIGGDLFINSSETNFSGNALQGGEIEVTIGDGGGLAVGGDMTLLSNGFAYDDENGVTIAEGGRAVVTMTGANAALSVGGALTISAQASPFSYNCECSPPPSGSGTGGTAALTATGGTIQIDSLSISASAEAFGGEYSYDGADLSATGGTATVSLGDSDASIGNVSISADAFGASATTGVDGGAATGGTASFSHGNGGSLSLGGLSVAADAYGGAGSNSYESGDPSRGGDATGGTASVSFGQSPTGLSYLDVSAQAEGGSGGSASNASGVSGAAGGDATGGTVSLTLTGADTVLTGLIESRLDAGASGGEGGDGEADYNETVQSGAGGAGGFGRAGSITVTAAGGAEYAAEIAFGASGSGGSGGSGGDAVFGEGGSADPGAGGRGGDGYGGDVSLIADGGTIGGSFEIEAYGNGGQGGLNGYVGETYPGQGDYGAYVGGAITLTATDNGASRFDVDSAVLRTGGDTTGTIAIVDETTEFGAGMRFGSLFAQASGLPIEAAPTIRVSAVANDIRVDGTAELYGDSIGLSFTGSGGLDVGGFTLFSANRDITITHTGNEGELSLHSGGPIEMYAGGDVLAEPGSVIATADYANIRAVGSITIDDVRSLGDISLAAEGDVTLANASAGSNFNLYAGRLDLDGSYGYVPSATATITGTVTVGGSAQIESGGFAVFAGGSQVLSDNAITVRTGDDIVVASGASLVSDIDPFEEDTIRLLAGDINFGPNEGDLVEPIGTPIASLILDGSLDSSGQSIFLSGDAIQGTNGSITTGNLTVDVTDAPPFGPYSSDGGLLTADCRQGSACLGSVTATGNVAIGLASNGGLVSLEIGAIEFTGGSFDALAVELIDIGTSETGSLLAGGSFVQLETLQGNVSLTEVTVDSADIAIRAGGSIDAASSTIQSPNDILLQVGSDITVGTINTGGRLDDGSGSPTFTVPGNLTVQSLSYGGGADMLIDAGGAIAVTFADPGSANIDMSAGGDLYLGNTGGDTRSIRLDGANVSFNNLVANGVVRITSSGDISGFSEVSPVISTTGGIALEAGGAVSVLDLEAGTDIAISGASVSTGALSAGGAIAVEAAGTAIVSNFSSGTSAVFSGGSVDLGSGSAGSFLAVQATEGDIVFGSLEAATSGVLQASGALTGGDITVGGALSLEGGSMAIGSAEGGAGITATIGGNAAFAALTSGTGSITLDVAGETTGELVDAAGDVGITGGTVGIDEVTAGGDLLIDAFSITADTLSAGGDMTLALDGGAIIGTAVAGGDLSLSAGNGIGAGLLDAGNALFVSTSVPAVIDEAVAGTDLTINASILQSQNLVAGQSIEVNAGAGATIEDAVAGGDFSFTGSELTAGSISAGNAIDVAVSLNAAVDSFVSGGDASITGRSLDLGSGSVDGNLSARSSEGALGFDDLTVGLDAQVLATGNLSGGDVAAGGTLSLEGANIALGSASGGGGVVGVTPGSFSFTTAESTDGFISLEAGGALTGGNATAQGGITLDGASISLGSAASGEGLLFVARSGNLTGSGLFSAGNTVDLQAAQNIAIGSVDAAGEITMTAGAEARFVEVRSRDGSVAIDAGGAILGSSVAALGSIAGGEDNVSLVAGGAITLDGATSVLNTGGSSAQDDFVAEAGGALSIVGAAAGRDLVFTAGAGMLSAADVAAGRDLSLTGPAVQLADGNVARNLTVEATAGNITGSGTTTAGGTIDLDASGAIAVGSLAANGGDLTVAAGGSIGFTDLSASSAIALSAGGAVTGSSLDAANGVSAQGTSLALGDVSGGEGDVGLSASEGALTAGDLSGGSINAQATGALSLGAVAASREAILVGASIDFGSVAAGSSVAIQAESDIAGGPVSASDFASIFARDAITLTGLIADDAYVGSEGGPVSVTGIAVSGAMYSTGSSVNLSATGALRLGADATAGDLAVTTTGDLTVEALATGDIALASTGGSVTITQVVQQGGGFTGIGTQAVGGGGAVSVSAANGIAVLDSLTAGGALDMTAGGLVSLTGVASGQTIALQAGDLAIGSNGSLGGANTQRISLASRSEVNLGSGASGGFAVDTAEFARIQSTGDLLITALAGEGGGSGTINVGSLTVNAGSGGQIGIAGTFGLTAGGQLYTNSTLGTAGTVSPTGGVINVNSALSVAGGGTATTLAMAGDVIDLDYANAQVSVLDSAGATTGWIGVSGRLITSISDSARADIAGDTAAQIDARLGQADTVREVGLFRTGTLTLAGRDAILIQNSGAAAADDRRGVNVGALTVSGAQNGSTLVVINGIVAGETGIDAAQAVTVNGSLDPGSTVNGCALANIAGCSVIPEPEPPLIVAPGSVLFGTGDFIKEEEEDDEVEDGVADGKPEAPPIDTTRIDDPAGLPMIDDPVTGAGNEDLWQQPDE